MIDLHTHTNYSDGTDTLIELLQKANDYNIEYLSITDHNTCEAHVELRNIDYKQYFSGNIITGIELSTQALGVGIELLGYQFDIDKMNNFLNQLYKSKEELNKIEFYSLIYKLRELGVNIQEQDILDYKFDMYTSTYIHKVITKDISNKKYFDEISFNNSSVFYRQYMSYPGSPLYIDMSTYIPDISALISSIKNAGGLVFIPHIFEYGKNSHDILKYLLSNFDIDGIECYYPNFTEKDTSYLIDICNSKKLFMSGGSDYHGSFKPNISLGYGKSNLNIHSSIINSWVKH